MKKPLFPLLFLCLIFPVSSHAALYEQIAIDARAQALGNAVTADPPGIMAIHFNPAGLSLIENGMTVSFGVSTMDVRFEGEYTADPDFMGFIGGFDGQDAQGRGDTSSMFHIPFTDHYLSGVDMPSYGVSYRKKDSPWTLAFGGYQPYFMGWEQTGNDNPGEYDGKMVVHQHYIYAAPSVSYQMLPSLSLGFTAALGNSYNAFKTSIRMPNDMIGLANYIGEYNGIQTIEPYDRMGVLDIDVEDDAVPSFNVGVLWSPFHWVSLGLVYQSEISSTMKGNYSLTLTQSMISMLEYLNSQGELPQAMNSENQYGSCTLKAIQPQRAQIGVAFQPIKKLKIFVDAGWTNWATVEDIHYVFDQELSVLQFANINGYAESPNELVLKRDFKDTVNLGAGVEYAVTSGIALRFGYEMRPSSVKDKYYDLMYPIPDLQCYSAGLGITLKSGISVDIGFSYIAGNDVSVDNNASENMNSTDWTLPIYNPYTGLDYTQKTEIMAGSVKLTVPLGRN